MLQSGVSGHEVRVVDETSLDGKKSNMKENCLIHTISLLNYMLVINCNVN